MTMRKSDEKINTTHGNRVSRRFVLAAAPALAACSPAAALTPDAVQGACAKLRTPSEGMAMMATPDVPKLVTEVQRMRSDLGSDGIEGRHEYYVVREERMAAIFDALDGARSKLSTPHDPIPGWFEEWKRKSKVWEDAIDGPQEEAAFQERHALERLICTTQPISREGAIAQLEYAMDDFGDYITGNIWHDLDAKLFANLLAGLKGGVTA